MTGATINRTLPAIPLAASGRGAGPRHGEEGHGRRAYAGKMGLGRCDDTGRRALADATTQRQGVGAAQTAGQGRR
jgi:hypothetical protein